MEPVAMMEVISIAYVLMSLIRQFLEREKSKEMRWLRVCSILSFVWLLADALTYVLDGPGGHPTIVFIMGIFSYTMSSYVLMGFMCYCISYFGERTKMSSWVFRIPIIILFFNTLIINHYYFTGQLLERRGDYYEVIGELPAPVLFTFVFFIFYPTIIGIFKKREIGTSMVLVYGLFGLPVIISLLVLIFTGKDLTVLMGVISNIFIITLLQNNSVQSRLEKAREEAEKANKSKTDFLFSMSHDIRTPMSAILGYVDIALRHEDDKERVHDSLIKTKSSGSHLLNLINDILEMSRIESGRLEFSEHPMDIHDTISSVSQMSKSLALSKDIRFISEIGEIKNPLLVSDELHVNEILINLISNAVKYNKAGGCVEFRTEQIGDTEGDIAHFRFTVKDTGIGMSEEFQKHLFEDFSRENTTTVSRQEGAGLGMSIVKRIVDMAGGTIFVKSKKGEGSVITVELPMKIMDAETEKEFRAESVEEHDIRTDYHLEGRRVLLVEDNDFNREIAIEILEEAGMEVDEAEDGDIAVKMVTEKGVSHYDFILMDIQMPVMDGYEATAEIRKMPDGHSIPIIALSANAFKEDMEKSFSVGMNAHIAKPIDVKALMETLTAYIK